MGKKTNGIVQVESSWKRKQTEEKSKEERDEM